jgi:ATP-dependent Lhr-like helicase
LVGLLAVLREIDDGEIACVARDTAEPSPFCHEILNANPYAYLDDAPLEERRARAVSVRRSLPSSTDEIGALDASAIEEVRAEAWPDVRSADELHDALMSLGMVRVDEAPAEWLALYEQLAAARRATTLAPLPDGGGAWAPAERLAAVRACYPAAGARPEIRALDAAEAHDPDAVATALVRDRLSVAGPVTAAALADRLALAPAQVGEALVRLELEGIVLRGRFTPGLAPATLEWCERHLLARIHRRTLARLRREIEPVSTADFMRFLLRWQHVAPGTQLHGKIGLRAVVCQLQGFELPAAAWERSILPLRIAKYDPAWLDGLSLAGEVAWGRLSAADRAIAVDGAARRRGGPTRIAPIGLCLRDDLPWLLARSEDSELAPQLSHAAQAVVDHLSRRGASFFSDLVAGTRRLRSEVEDGLGEAVAAGLVTADGFAALRALLGGKPRASGRRRGLAAGARHASGRWALLHPVVDTPPPTETEADAIERAARQLLRRWGVVCRDLLARETRTPPWRELAVCYRRLEARGEIRGGRFIAGRVGEHFALPEAVEALRAVRRAPPAGERIAISPADPLNLVGILTPGGRISPISSAPITIVDGAPCIDAAEATG